MWSNPQHNQSSPILSDLQCYAGLRTLSIFVTSCVMSHPYIEAKVQYKFITDPKQNENAGKMNAKTTGAEAGKPQPC